MSADVLAGSVGVEEMKICEKIPAEDETLDHVGLDLRWKISDCRIDNEPVFDDRSRRCTDSMPDGVSAIDISSESPSFCSWNL